MKYIKGVGEVRAKLLAEQLNVHTPLDMLYTFPFRYVDRSKFYAISDLNGDVSVQVRGHFVNFCIQGEGARQRLVGSFTDGRSIMEVVWFSKIKSISRTYQKGLEYILFGKPSKFNGAWSMVHPEVELYKPDTRREGFRGIYNLTEMLRKRNVNSRLLQDIVRNILAIPNYTESYEPLPKEIISKLHLMPFAEAIRTIHFPSGPQKLAKARERFKFEELFYLQLNILRYAERRTKILKGIPFSRIGEHFNYFYYNQLPFPLTDAQKRVIKEIRIHTGSGKQMNRLLQGDVGSGKTMVAYLSALMAIDNNCQAAILAPTEILATQHYESLRQWAEPAGIRIELLTGSTRSRRRRDIDEGLLSGDVKILVGTHAVLEEHVKFQRLGIAIIDEQHRFGVAQRARIWGKNVGEAPHVLVMTATPIPRTLAMTLYGDLEVSVIDELPPGRKPITTILRYEGAASDVDRLVAGELRAGRQVYIVYPLIKENEKLQLKSLEKDIEYIAEKYRGFNVCYVHGRMKPDEKEHQMNLFVSGKAQILVATTVIEVGVNVPNASVMIIQNAERFGLSQLHQLRGRVGRGAEKSYCILMTKQQIAADTRKRLTLMTETSDGFRISEADMQMRGPGDLEGTQQSGIPINLHIANLATDGQLVALARQTAEKVLDANPQVADKSLETTEPIEDYILSEQSRLVIKEQLAIRFARDADWSLIS